MGWLALMQHYGAPTRLLDWTYSFYVAAYFALRDAPNSSTVAECKVCGAKEDFCVVWAIKRESFGLTQQAPNASEAFKQASNSSLQADLIRSDTDNSYDGINAFLLSVMEKPEPSIWAVNAFRLNERLSVQQGAFFCPGDVRISFEDNLKVAHSSAHSIYRMELSIAPEARRDMLTAIHQMNISSASLFPGLAGFAQSLKDKLWLPETLRPEGVPHL
jgi:hypothetical protein